jgi:hypothetical protein
MKLDVALPEGAREAYASGAAVRRKPRTVAPSTARSDHGV